MEEAAYAYFAKIDELGGMVEAIKQNYPQREIADAAFTLQEEIERGAAHRRGRQPLPAGRGSPARAPARSRRSSSASRSAASRPSAPGATGEAVEAALAELREAAAADRNLMDPLLDAARAHATEGEIVQSLQQVFGTYTETPVF